MFIEKFFHINLPVTETKTRLNRVNSYRRELESMHKAIVTDEGLAHFEFEVGMDHSAWVDLVQLPSPDENTILFRSTRGTVEMTGMIEFCPIKPNLTEVKFALDYEIKSILHRAVDRLSGTIDAFLNRQLQAIQSHFEGVGTLAAQPMTELRPLSFARAEYVRAA
jgi:uncharacterized membrane protein